MRPSTVALRRRPVLAALMSVYAWRGIFGWLSERNYENRHCSRASEIGIDKASDGIYTIRPNLLFQETIACSDPVKECVPRSASSQLRGADCSGHEPRSTRRKPCPNHPSVTSSTQGLAMTQKPCYSVSKTNFATESCCNLLSRTYPYPAVSPLPPKYPENARKMPA